MATSTSRRHFLRTSAAALAGLATAPSQASAAPAGAFSFVLLGDLHYDKLAHHDMAWLQREKAGDLRQIENYSRLTAEMLPRLFARVQATVAALQPTAAPPSMVLQVGDLVEGLCGTEALARTQSQEALDFVQGARLGVPFLFTKGNHDVTGPGATEAFASVLTPFLKTQRGDAQWTGANYTFTQGEAQFCCFDAYDKTSLDWLEATLAQRTARHCLGVIHPPVVLYGARATWHLYSSPKDQAKRERLLTLLGKQEAVVLGGHIHKFNTLLRKTAGGGRFRQLAVSSVIAQPEMPAKSLLEGPTAYTGDQIAVELSYEPATAEKRRAVYEAERPSVESFAYADLPGYAILTVAGPRITAQIYGGTGTQLWRTISLAG